MTDESVQGENSEVDEETSDLNPEEDSKEDVGRDILEFLEGKFPDSTFWLLECNERRVGGV